MEIMRRDYSFSATYVLFAFPIILFACTDAFVCSSKHQYQFQLKKWKLSKNRKGIEWEALARIVRAREKQGLQSEVYYKGELVPHEKLSREISRYGFTLMIQRFQRGKY